MQCAPRHGADSTNSTGLFNALHSEAVGAVIVSSPNPPKWRARGGADVLWAIFGNDYIAFHVPSAKTHFLNLASYALLTEVLVNACDIDEITEAFVTNEQLGSKSVYRDQMKGLLDHLDSLGLVDKQ